MTILTDTDLQEGIAPAVEEAAVPVTEHDDEMQKPLYNKRQVADIVKRERDKALKKGRSEALMEIEQQAPQPTPPVAAPVQQQSVGLGGMPAQISEEHIKKIIAEQVPHHLQRQVHEAQANQIAQQFSGKIDAAVERFPDLKQKMDMLDYNDPGILGLVHLTNQLDNTGDVFNELLENPAKLSGILAIVGSQPKLAQHHLTSLSNSIKQNQQALAEHQSAPEPLSQIKPTAKSGVDNGNMSVSDYRKMFLTKK